MVKQCRNLLIAAIALSSCASTEKDYQNYDPLTKTAICVSDETPDLRSCHAFIGKMCAYYNPALRKFKILEQRSYICGSNECLWIKFECLK